MKGFCVFYAINESWQAADWALGMKSCENGRNLGGEAPVLMAEDDEQRSHQVDHLQHTKGSNTGHIFTWFSSSLFSFTCKQAARKQHLYGPII